MAFWTSSAWYLSRGFLPWAVSPGFCTGFFWKKNDFGFSRSVRSVACAERATRGPERVARGCEEIVNVARERTAWRCRCWYVYILRSCVSRANSTVEQFDPLPPDFPNSKNTGSVCAKTCPGFSVQHLQKKVVAPGFCPGFFVPDFVPDFFSRILSRIFCPGFFTDFFARILSRIFHGFCPGFFPLVLLSKSFKHGVQ